MMIKISLRASGLIALALCLSVDHTSAQKKTQKTTPVTAATQLPLDPLVKTGTLPNGFTYYIQRNTEPQKRVQLYLVVKAGSILEDDDQRGLAHYLEHMAFNGTKHFPKNSLIDYLEKSGVRFGADLNAYTSFDETVYQLPLPADDTLVLKNGYLIMRDWAQNALLEQAELDKERGVILEEKRMGKGVKDRIREKTLPVTLNHSRYASRLPIGTEEVLNTFTRERIAAFYQDWYRPDLEALIVVGDIDVAQTEQQIRALFADLRNPRKEKKRTAYTIPLTGKNQFLAVTDKEQPYTTIQLAIKHSRAVVNTTTGLRKEIVASLFNSILNERLGDLAKQDPPPFLRAAISIGPFFHNLDALSLYVIPRPGETESGFKTLYTELARIKKSGISEAALKRAKARYSTATEAAYLERDKTPSSDFVDIYVQHFTQGDVPAGIAYEHVFVKDCLNTIGIEDLNALVKEYFTDINRDIILTAPESEQATLPDATTMERWIAEVNNSKLEPVKETDGALVLMEHAPVAGKVVAQQPNAAVGITEITLSNGVRVILKSTAFKNDEILIQGFSPGGTSLYSNKDYASASAAGDLMAASGVGNINALQLPKVLNGKRVGAKPFINERFEGISAAAGKQEMETALQLVHLYITEPRKDSTLFKSFYKRQEAALLNRYNSPENVFADTINAVLGNHNYRRTAPSVAKLQTISLDRTYNIYRERFADAGDFTFVMVGSFTVGEALPLIEKYLGSLPALHRKEAAADLGIRIPTGKIVKKVYKGHENKATVRLVFSGNHTYNQQNNLQLDGLKEVLQLRLTERLREEEGGVYSPSVSLGYTKYPTATYTFSVVFDCAPANVDKLIAAAINEIEKLKKNGVRTEDVQKYLAAKKRAWETMQTDNEFWYNFLANVYMENEPPTKALTYLEALDKITPVSLQQTANTCFDMKNVIEFVLLPEAVN